MYIIVSFLVAGWLFSGVEAAFVETTEPRILVIAFGAMLATLPSLFLGVVAWLSEVLFRRLGIGSRIDAWVDRNDDEGPGWATGVSADAVVAIVALAVALAVSVLVYPRLFGLQLTRLAQDLAIVFAVTQVYVAVAGIIVLWRFFHGATGSRQALGTRRHRWR